MLFSKTNLSYITKNYFNEEKKRIFLYNDTTLSTLLKKFLQLDYAASCRG